MPLHGHQRPFNPSVEDARTSSDTENDHAPKKKHRTQMPWPEHEKVIASHLEMLHIVMNDVPNGGEAFNLASNMVETTNKLMAQFNLLKKQLALSKLPDSLFGTGAVNNSEPGTETVREAKNIWGTLNTPKGPSHSMPGRPSRRRGHSNERNKRTRQDQDYATTESTSTDFANSELQRSHKRKRLAVSTPAADVDVRHVTPVSIDTEDISQEVQRRLEIKEERRRKRDSNPKQEKRKRESAGSEGAASFDTLSKPRKRSRVEMETDQLRSTGKRGRGEPGTYFIDGLTESSTERKGSKRQKPEP
ncbi:hypothetical protein FE257_001583 [Aspergillus nanangensis]|uniref:Uncharacterized protein n=1 Tax=Aspergillus nanangensis TaxID=2582783 RepID=A0AAD4CTM0_ASPNN|nr:hypothetical protein FE257_001583 [Aspergillus nanangensis]